MNSKSSGKIQDFQSCTICLNKKVNSQINPCQHKFCFKCINRWSKKQSSCPLCREQITQIQANKKIVRVKQIINSSSQPNPSMRSIRRNPNQSNINMILIPYPIINYPWSYQNYIVSPHIYFNNCLQYMNFNRNNMFFTPNNNSNNNLLTNFNNNFQQNALTH